ncbi:MAG: ABC transporter permease [Acidobacteriota bacterium]|jgi:rhamnose transport system permease protein|nr:ABC transporter permease [Acidobacteriota bacterium]
MMVRRLRGLLGPEEAAVLALLVVTFCAMGALNPRFFETNNLLEMSRFFVETGLVALAMAPIIITGGIDLSVGSMVGLSVVVMGMGWRHLGLGPGPDIALGLVAGGLAGFVNGLFISKVRIPPLIVTLATMALYRGIALGLGARAPVSDFPPEYYELGQAYYTVLGAVQVPQQLPLLVVLGVSAAVVLHRTVFGRWVYAIGHNERAAWFAGVPVPTVRLVLYTFSGLMSALAGAVFLSRVATAKADAGTLMELDVITVCVLGGVSIYGGKGSILGAVLGLLVVSSLVRGLTLGRVPFEDQKIILGAVLLIAAVAQHFLAQRATRARTSAAKSEPAQ